VIDDRNSIAENLLGSFVSRSFMLISSILSRHVPWELREKQKFCKNRKIIQFADLTASFIRGGRILGITKRPTFLDKWGLNKAFLTKF
jgi:hypothetical protein